MENEMYAGRIEKLLAYYTPMPMCIVSPQGKVTRASRKIAEVFKYDGIVDYDIFALTGIKMNDFIKAATDDTPLYIKRNDKNFRIACSFLGSEREGDEVQEDRSIIMNFVDVTAYEKLKELYNNERVYILLVNVDNMDELIAEESEHRELEIAVEIDRLIRGWGAEMGAMVA